MSDLTEEELALLAEDDGDTPKRGRRRKTAERKVEDRHLEESESKPEPQKADSQTAEPQAQPEPEPQPEPQPEPKTSEPQPEAPAASRGPYSPAQYDDDGWNDLPVQMRG